MSFLLLFISTIFVNNIVLVKFLGLCPFMGVSQRIDTATGMAMATTFVLTLTSLLTYALYHFFLVPFHIEYLQTLTFILAIAVVVQFSEILIKKNSPILYRILGVFLPLITSNCAVLGVCLLNINQHHTLMQSLIYAIGTAIGFSLVLIWFSYLNEKVQVSDVPLPFKGTPIRLITAGLMSLAFMGFLGIA
jgi:electron transport complex protein RnfA